MIIEGVCNCSNVAIGSYDNQVMLGWYPVMDAYKLQREKAGLSTRGICVDTCLAKDITTLWESGIRTMGSCCGHGMADGMINIHPEDFDKALELGWEMFAYDDEPDRRDTVRWPRSMTTICPDCGNPLGEEYEPGDVCSDCFQAWDGLTTDEIIGLTLRRR